MEDSALILNTVHVGLIGLDRLANNVCTGVARHVVLTVQSQLPRFFFLHTIAVCRVACANGGTCTAPSVCACTEGWSGNTCQQGLVKFKLENSWACIMIESFFWQRYVILHVLMEGTALHQMYATVVVESLTHSQDAQVYVRLILINICVVLYYRMMRYVALIL